MSRAPAASAVDVRTRGNSSPMARRAATIGEMAALAVEVVLSLARPPFPRWREYVRQCVFILHAPFRALGGAVAVYAFGAPGLEGGGFSSFADRTNHRLTHVSVNLGRGVAAGPLSRIDEMDKRQYVLRTRSFSLQRVHL